MKIKSAQDIKFHIFVLSTLMVSCAPPSKTALSTEVSSIEKTGISKQLLETSEAEVTHLALRSSWPESAPFGWKVVFEDNFDAPSLAISKGVDPKCFSGTPVCMLNTWISKERVS